MAVEETTEKKEAPIRRFVCDACGATKDQQVRRRNARRIGCVCGGDAFMTGEVPTVEFRWWTDANGREVGQRAAEVGLILTAGGEQTPPTKTGLLRRIFGSH